MKSAILLTALLAAFATAGMTATERKEQRSKMEQDRIKQIGNPCQQYAEKLAELDAAVANGEIREKTAAQGKIDAFNIYYEAITGRKIEPFTSLEDDKEEQKRFELAQKKINSDCKEEKSSNPAGKNIYYK